MGDITEQKDLQGKFKEQVLQVKLNGCLRLRVEAGDTGQQGHKEIHNGAN